MIRYFFSFVLFSTVAALFLPSRDGRAGVLSEFGARFAVAHAPSPLSAAPAVPDAFHPDQPRSYFEARWPAPVTADSWSLDGLTVTVSFDAQGRAQELRYRRTSPASWSADSLAGALAANGRAWARVPEPPSLRAAFARALGIVPALDGRFTSADGASAVLSRRLLIITSPAENRRIQERAEALRTSNRNPANY